MFSCADVPLTVASATDMDAGSKSHVGFWEEVALSSFHLNRVEFSVVESSGVDIFLLCSALGSTAGVPAASLQPCGVPAALRRPPLSPKQDINLTKTRQLKKG